MTRSPVVRRSPTGSALVGDLLPASRAGLVVLASLLVVVATAGCGRKGPPLPPLVQIPASIDDLDVRRVGDEVFVTFTVPAQNVDASTPAAVRRVDVLAVTAASRPSRDEFLRDGSRIASITVTGGDGKAGARDEAGPTPAVAAAQGEQVTVREAVPETSPDAPDAAAVVPGRHYLALAVSANGRESPAGLVRTVSLIRGPEAPLGVVATHTAEAIALAWDTGPDDLVYNVYLEDRSDPDATASPEPAGPAPPRPLNEMPLTEPPFIESLLAFGRERCYRVRAIRGADTMPVEGAPSARVCLTPEDLFPPSPPTDLVAVAGPDGIGLRWAPNWEADLVGYVVLRGAPGDVTLLPVTGMPVVETQYLDRDVVPGMRYEYAVIAVDSRNPPNRSSESARDAATAR